ncbi:succinate dehydrogenase, cytochrome b556 subunit [Thiohalobacter sp. IOR34]|uniref:succinate dehydrogenase, cytochrome b556 subunit n=1 Tax=Thiohalobacter sp. IOR34 TaxID=3057176 RepID=UPI0025B1B48A|nr:succinate dehydrogenase, cytochrome b556 subunit [Thiohalobacter sp. IOR34]WJW76743.1 succinate dehydrogenase, cytochrome b556 subunit [Thiohalobacter sp. IOR34]
MDMPPSPPRPKFLDLLVIRMPIGAVTSILHRLSGVLLFLSLPLAAFLLDLSLRDADGFARAIALLHAWPARLASLLLGWALLHHLLAGLRFLLLDLGIGLERPVARRLAWSATLGALLLLPLLLWGLA